MSIKLKMSEAMMNMGQPKKNKKGHTGKYAPLDEVIRVIEEQTKKVGLVVYTTVEQDSLTAKCVDPESGDEVTSSVPFFRDNILRGSSNPMQELGAAITYARRYALQNLFNLAAEDDDDASSLSRKDNEVASTVALSEKQIKNLRINDLSVNRTIPPYDRQAVVEGNFIVPTLGSYPSPSPTSVRSSFFHNRRASCGDIPDIPLYSFGGIPNNAAPTYPPPAAAPATRS